VPFVLVLGVLTTFLWANSLPFDRALLAGLAVLVVACPCAVGLAAPLATSLGIGRLARSGCLVREPAALEALGRCRLIAFDKTGTLTSGTPRIVDANLEGADYDEVLARAAGLERHLDHDFARAITMAADQRGLEPATLQDVRVVPGRGIRGSIDRQVVAAGNGAFMKDLGWQPGPVLGERARVLGAGGHSLIYVGWAGRVYGVLALDDTPLPEARSTIEQLCGLGLHVAILTGDLKQAANRLAAAVGVADTMAGLSPEEKRDTLGSLRHTYPVVAMVGDGLNDGLALADSDVGIAVGSATDLARETATLVLPAGGLWMLPWVISVARMVRRTIITNLIWAFGYNSVALTLAALGLLQPVLAAAVMASSSLLLVLNSLRLARLPDPVSGPTRKPGAGPVGVLGGLGLPAMTRSAVERG
jgi:P-type Cu2+ transporter